MKQQHIGSDFDDFLREEGNFAEPEAIAFKHVAALSGVDETFTRQVDEFIEQYHLALETLARQ
jgi:hypothetical protein